MIHFKPFLFAVFVVFTLSTASAQKQLSNELIWFSPEFSAESMDDIISMNDGLHYTVLEFSDLTGSTIVKYDFATGTKKATVASSASIFGNIEKSIESYSFNKDESKLLIQTSTEPIYRRSFTAEYFVYDLNSKNTTRIAGQDEKVRLADFSPDSKKVAFVRNNDIYYKDLVTNEEVRVTSDGKVNEIINGATDWVYEEEFGFDKGFYWSPSGSHIAYYRFDETKVPEFSMDLYGELYPEAYRFKYPKAGEKNSDVTIWIYNVSNKSTLQVNTGNDKEQYFPRIKWSSSDKELCIMRMNRHQNKLEFLLTDLNKVEPFEHSTNVIYKEVSDTYIDVNDALTFLSDGSGFIWNSEKNGFNHLYRFDMKGNEVLALTSGKWDVIDFYGYDEQTSTVYFSSSEDGAIEKHIYSIQQGKKKPIKKRLNSGSGYNDATFNKGFKFFILQTSDANTPFSFSLHESSGKLIRGIKVNVVLKQRLASYGLSKKEFFTFTNRDGIDLNCWMIKPKNFDPNKKYPVLVAIYGGPGHNTVLNQWEGRNYLWHQLLAKEGYIVVSVDPRGTQYQGRKFKHATYMNLGKLETNDFIDFAGHLGKQSFIDSTRIGIQGWSYGGYMTSLCMTKGADYFKTGIAVAPVTNWKYYDSIYTERFMRTPQENEGGYENNSPINFVKELKGKFLIVHGSADDNVHFQNTMDMITALVKANKQFDQFTYPNKNHGIYGGNTRLHLYTMMTNYLKANL